MPYFSSCMIIPFHWYHRSSSGRLTANADIGYTVVRRYPLPFRLRWRRHDEGQREVRGHGLFSPTPPLPLRRRCNSFTPTRGNIARASFRLVVVLAVSGYCGGLFIEQQFYQLDTYAFFDMIFSWDTPDY